MSSNLIRKLTFSLFGLLLVAAMAVPGMAQYDRLVDPDGTAGDLNGSPTVNTSLSAALTAASHGEVIAIEHGEYSAATLDLDGTGGSGVEFVILNDEDGTAPSDAVTLTGNLTLSQNTGGSWTLTVGTTDETGSDHTVQTSPTIDAGSNTISNGANVTTLLGSSLDLTIGGTLTNSGTLDINGRSLTLSDAQALAGNVDGGDGSISGVNAVSGTLDLTNSNLTLNDDITLSGTIDVNDQTLTAQAINANGASANLDDGTGSNAGTVDADVTVGASSSETLVLGSSNMLNLDGSLTVDGTDGSGTVSLNCWGR